MLRSFEEKQKYHVTVRVGLRNSAAVFETIARAKRCRVYAPWVNAMSAAYIHTGHLPS